MWSSWQDIEQVKVEQRSYPGIYQIRMVNQDGNPRSIPRLMGTDEEGILYIGKVTPNRTLAKRIREFQSAARFGSASHSGGETYVLVWMNLIQSDPAYKDCKIQYRVMSLYADLGVQEDFRHRIEEEESKALADYFHKYGELPPCNSSFPGKWNVFSERLQKLWGTRRRQKQG